MIFEQAGRSPLGPAEPAPGAGAEGAAFAIVMARTGDDAATMFLVDTDNPGVSVTRVISTIDTTFSGGHAPGAVYGRGPAV